MIFFPKIEELWVRKYKLYPGNDEQELHHIFQPSVNIILGINGLGKTTLLNILLRLLTGPNDIPSGQSLGRGVRKVQPIDVRYFADRVPDRANEAVASAIFSFGKRKIYIERKLSDLSLISCKIDGEPIFEAEINKEAKEDIYQGRICDLSGLSGYFDFLTTLHFLIFYLEGRASAFWSEETQFEILRILFHDPSTQEEYLKSRNEISRLDSQYRNIANAKSQVEKILAQTKAARPEEVKDLEKQRVAEEGLKEKLQQFVNEVDGLDQERRRIRSELETVKFNAAALEDDVEKDLEKYYASFLPDLNATAKLMLGSVASGRGCLVCGSTNKKNLQLVLERAENHHCPLCESNVKDMDTNADEKTGFRKKFIEKEKNLKKQKELISNYVTSLQDIQNKYTEARTSLLQTRDELMQIEMALASARRAQKGSDLKEKESELGKYETALEKITSDITTNSTKLRAVLDQENQRILHTQKRICEIFSEVISSFIAEKCELRFEESRRPVGQLSKEQFDFPLFTVWLSGGASQGEITKREGSSSVSESQKEFIELAFRISLIAVAKTKEWSMLVLETPEASLDTYFMDRAGRKIREISKDNICVVATSNLSRERVVPAMLGIPNEEEIQNFPNKKSETKIQDRKNYILDLLDVAAPTAALLKFRPEYEWARDNSIWPSWEKKNG